MLPNLPRVELGKQLLRKQAEHLVGGMSLLHQRDHGSEDMEALLQPCWSPATHCGAAARGRRQMVAYTWQHAVSRQVQISQALMQQVAKCTGSSVDAMDGCPTQHSK